MDQTLALYKRFEAETGDPVAASNLVLAQALFEQNGRTHETALTVSEAAGRLKCSEKKVYQLCESGDLGHQRIGRSIRIQPADIDTFLAKTSETPEPVSRRSKGGLVKW